MVVLDFTYFRPYGTCRVYPLGDSRWDIAGIEAAFPDLILARF